MKPDSGRSGAQSVERALGVLRALAASDDDLGVSDLAARCRLSSSTAHRLLQALRSDGLVAQDPRTERYHLGPGLVALGQRAESRVRFDRLLPHVRDLAETSGESVSLGTRLGDEVLIVLHVDSPEPLRFDQAPGTHVPVHASGIGKALLAFAGDPAAEVAALGTLVSFTDATLTDPSLLLADLARARSRGWALNDGERHLGVRTMAAPVPDLDGRPWAGVAIQGPTARLTDRRLGELADDLLNAAATLGRDALGSRP
ncbi:MAG: IclR family transcriptional regulator [Ilumatobacteraceae bacterium]